MAQDIWHRFLGVINGLHLTGPKWSLTVDAAARSAAGRNGDLHVNTGSDAKGMVSVYGPLATGETAGWQTVAVGKRGNAAVVAAAEVAAAATEDLTDNVTVVDISVPGANLGDLVIMGYPDGTPPEGLLFWPYVQAADVVRIRVGNPTAGALTPDNGTYTVMVFPK